MMHSPGVVTDMRSMLEFQCPYPGLKTPEVKLSNVRFEDTLRHDEPQGHGKDVL